MLPALCMVYDADVVGDGVRNEIASCEEAAYDRLPLKDAATLLFFNTPSELLTFAKEVRLFYSSPMPLIYSHNNLISQRGWQVDLSGGVIHFNGKNEEQAEVMPRHKLIAASLKYARELEMIV